MKKETENNEKITFSQYYRNLDTDGKNAIKTMILEFISESHFYNCIRNNKFNKLLRKEIESKVNLKFNWKHE